MQTQPTPISQIVTPNATPGPANRAQAPATSADGDFQRALDRQIEQRQLSRNMAQTQAQTPRNSVAPAPTQQTQQPQTAGKTGDSEAAPVEQPRQPEPAANEAHASSDSSTAATTAKDSSEAEDSSAAARQPAQEDPAAAMLALVGSIKLAMQQPATTGKTMAETPASTARVGAKADGKSLTAAQLLANEQADKNSSKADDFADSLGQAQGKAAGATVQGNSLPSAKADANKLAIDLQVAASSKNATPLAEPLLKEAPADISKLAAQLQPAALQQAAAAAAVPADKLAGRVGTPAWDQQLGQKVVWMAAGGDQTATLTLNPPDLGPLKVVLTVTNDQANAAFMSAQPEVRQALEAAMPRLRDMMSEAGIAFGNATVSAGTQEQQNQGNREMGSDGRRGGHGNGSTGSNMTGGEIAIAPATASRARASLSAVDTFA